jgi:hypothetical protein
MRFATPKSARARWGRRVGLLLVPIALAVPVGGLPGASAEGGCGAGFTDNGFGVCAANLVATGGLQTLTVPAGVTKMTMTVAGGQGGWSLDQGTGSGAPGGLGGMQSATVPVTPGATLSIVIGQTGGVADLINPPPAPYGGGGAPGGGYGGYGGGGSFVFSSNAGLLIAAGGGGGSGYDYNPDASGLGGVQQAPGGAGAGASAAGDGRSVAFCCDPTFNPPPHVPPGGGNGATPTAPGAGGVPVGAIPGFGPSDGNPGQGPATAPNSLGVGGAGPAGSGASGCFSSWAGGGGGGYYGGGSGGNIACDLEGGGGGGGGGYVTPLATNAHTFLGVQAGDGQATLTYNRSTLVPSPPTGVKAISGSTTTATGSLTVSFAAGANNGSAITSFTATCTLSNGGAPKSKTGVRSPIIVAGVATAKAYKCTVKATNARGTSLPSTASLAVIVGTPAAPTGVKATKAKSGQLSVKFTPGANNGKPVTSFTATCSPTSSGVAKSKVGAASPLTVTSLSPGKTYKCTVFAKNVRGAGQKSIPSPAAIA